MKVKLQSGLKRDKLPEAHHLPLPPSLSPVGLCDNVPPKNAINTISKSLLLVSGQAYSFSVTFAAS